MPSIQIKDVPASTHEVLTRRAADAHMSLQEYLRSKLIDEASRPTTAEWLATVATRSKLDLSLTEIAALVREARDRP